MSAARVGSSLVRLQRPAAAVSSIIAISQPSRTHSSPLCLHRAHFATLPAVTTRAAPPPPKKFFRFRGAYYAQPAPKPAILQPQFEHIPKFCQLVTNELPQGRQYYFDLVGHRRESGGKNISNKLRETRNHIPAIVFDRHQPRANTKLISVERADIEALVREWQEPCLMTRVGSVNITDADTGAVTSTSVLINEINRHPVTQEILNITFISFAPTDKVKLSVPVAYINEEESLGYRRGALLLELKHSVRVWHCGAHTAIPTKLIVDLMNVDIGAIIRATDLVTKFPPTLKLFAPYKESLLVNMQNVNRRRFQLADEESAVPADGAAAATPAAGGAAGAGAAVAKAPAAAKK